jgi:hypothetical protein
MVAGCPPKRGGGPPPPQAGAGCPSANGVFVASYLTPEKEEADKAPDKAGHTGWVLPLYDKVVDSIANLPEYATIDQAAASAAGVPAPPASVWLLAGTQPCKATIGAYYAATIEAPSPNLTYGVELSGCPAPADPQSASSIVVDSPAPPADCHVVAPRPIAQRLGEVDKTNHWQRPTKQTPIPPALAGVIPTKPCTPPSCEQLWSLAQVDIGGKPIAWAGAVNWLAIPDGSPPEAQCTWKAEAFSGFFVAGPDGSPVKVTGGQDHPLALTAVLADAAGAKVLVAEGPGEYSTYDLAGGNASVGHHLVWLRPPPEAYEAIDHLGPDCGE